MGVYLKLSHYNKALDFNIPNFSVIVIYESYVPGELIFP